MKKQRSCTWKGKLGKLEEHLSNCDFVAVKCPKGCGKEMQRKDLKEHLEKECPNRTKPCKHRKKEIKWNELEDHYEECPKFPVECDSRKKENIPRRQVSRNAFVSCSFFFSFAIFAIFAIFVKLPSLPKCFYRYFCLIFHFCHIRSFLLQITQAGLKLGARRWANCVLSTLHLSNRTQTRREEVDELTRTVAELRNRTRHFERQLEETGMRQENQIRDLTFRFNRCVTKSSEVEGRLCNGAYIWKIDNYRQYRQDALSGVMTAIHSPSFYTSVYGYKLYMRINLNGVDSGVGKHVALFVHMMQGDYDSILEWPFTGRIALSILDQSDGAEYRHHISETLVAKPNLLAFQRPTAPRNYKGYGYVEFAPIEAIREPQYVRNNTMLVRIQIFQ
ncbi:unnamed protein product [Pocillopora meandrina]|uniref:Uncharacterized protein n=1 Tax=Pocillopora meandrina TaxID=46732 RepID=A0AAU9W7J8_9CNID|nr:unnamed protein product [Pocillopora meandrina]